MYMFENRITIQDRPILEEYLNGYEYKTSGLSFSAMYMWRDSNMFSWDMMGEYMLGLREQTAEEVRGVCHD